MGLSLRLSARWHSKKSPLPMRNRLLDAAPKSLPRLLVGRAALLLPVFKALLLHRPIVRKTLPQCHQSPANRRKHTPCARPPLPMMVRGLKEALRIRSGFTKRNMQVNPCRPRAFRTAPMIGPVIGPMMMRQSIGNRVMMKAVRQQGKMTKAAWGPRPQRTRFMALHHRQARRQVRRTITAISSARKRKGCPPMIAGRNSTIAPLFGRGATRSNCGPVQRRVSQYWHWAACWQ